jgi:NitT/TauT family transport system substrate-binding protein
MAIIQTRRRFLTKAALAGAAGLVRASPALAAEGNLERTSIRLAKFPSACLAPQYVAEELLRAEGFTEIEYLELAPDADISRAVAEGKAGFSQDFATRLIVNIDAGLPLRALAGVHVGCFELFGNDRIRSLADLKGKSVGADSSDAPHPFLSAMADRIGLDPVRDINWVLRPDAMAMFVDGKIDAYLGFPPEPQELRARGVGHVVVDSSIDRPWSQYFCCMIAGNRDFVRNYPVATKRVLRAILKAADVCATDPARAARRVVDAGITDRYDYAIEAVRQIPFDKWREYDPENTIRFCALRLHEAGMIKSAPNKIIADGTDWRFLN